MVIDFHNHLGIDLGAELSQTANELLARMDEANIERAVVFPFPGAPDLELGNATVWEAAERHADRLVPFMGVNPRAHRERSADDWEAELARRSARGIIIQPTVHHFSVRMPIVDPFMEACRRRRVPVVVQMLGHGQEDCSPLVGLATRYPDVPVVASPLVYCPGWETIAKNVPNLYADTARVLRRLHITKLVGVLGAERVLFGSETPYMCPLIEREKLRYAELADSAAEQVLSGNATRLLVGASRVD